LSMWRSITALRRGLREQHSDLRTTRVDMEGLRACQSMDQVPMVCSSSHLLTLRSVI
jgi:hypothetical protein